LSELGEYYDPNIETNIFLSWNFLAETNFSLRRTQLGKRWCTGH